MYIPLVENIKTYILNPIIYFLFAFALLTFIIGIVQYLNKDNINNKKADSARYIVWGAVGMAIMVSVYGLLNLVSNTVRALIS